MNLQQIDMHAVNSSNRLSIISSYLVICWSIFFSPTASKGMNITKNYHAGMAIEDHKTDVP